MKKFLIIVPLLSVMFSLSVPFDSKVNAIGDYSSTHAGHKYVKKHGISYKYVNEYTVTSEWPTVAWLSKAKVVRGDGASEYKESRMGYWVKADLRVNGKGAKYSH
ncbi:MAG: hypothetical protein ACK5NF_04815 [Bacilli bacterium]